ncbi:MAG: hypothetical protein QM777_16945 [Pseudorhodoferax sp.]
MRATATATRKAAGLAAVDGLTNEQLRNVLTVIAGRALTLRNFLCEDHADKHVAVDMAVIAIESIGALADEACDVEVYGTALGWSMGPTFD